MENLRNCFWVIFADSVLETCGGDSESRGGRNRGREGFPFSEGAFSAAGAVFPENTETCLRKLSFSGRIAAEGAVLSRLLNSTPPGSKRKSKIDAGGGRPYHPAVSGRFGKRSRGGTVLASGACRNLRRLAVNGKDLIEEGIPSGKAVGEMLNRLLMQVIEGSLRTKKGSLCWNTVKTAQKECRKNTVKFVEKNVENIVK